MKKVMLALACVVLLLGIVAAASAQEGGLMDKVEWNLAFNWMNVSDFDLLNVSAGLGQFITPNVQISLSGQMLDIESDDIWAVTPAVSYSFISENTTTLVPFVGLGWSFVGGALAADDTDNGLELEAGLRAFLDGNYNEGNTALFVKYQYINDVFGENINLVSLGVSSFF